MLTARKALALNSQSGPPLPKVPDLKALYDAGFNPRINELTMIVGRPGSQKSGFALWFARQLDVPTLYFSADMSPFQASIRLACMETGRTVEQMEQGIRLGAKDCDPAVILKDVKITFDFEKPLNWDGINSAITAFVELWGIYPELMIFDNLMDFAAGESDYAEQMAILQDLDLMKSETKATIWVLHHATDKGKNAAESPHLPPSRSEVKGGLAEKPENSLGVALNGQNLTFNIAVLKQRMGPSDPSGRTYVALNADPARTQFRAL